MTYEIEKTTERIISQLYNHGAQDMDKAALSALRSSSSIDSYRAQKIWSVFLSNLDEKWLSRTGKATGAEKAIFASIRMYALHQQTLDYCVFARKQFFSSAGANTESGLELFEVLDYLRQDEKIREALDRRIQALLGTINFSSAVDQLVHLIQIIKGKLKKEKYAIRIDYACLAGNLYKFQMGYRQANEVRLRWGEQYYHFFKKTVNKE